MYYSEDSKPQSRADHSAQQQLLLDGTVNLDYSDDETTESAGLLAWLKQQLGVKTN